MIAALVLIAAWGFNYFGDTGFIRSAPENQALIKVGDECISISERASAHLVPKLEFQRLELQARKANVVVRCMADRNYYQSPAWLKYAQPIAARISSQQHVSVDEALETLKRADMLVFESAPNKPVYWQYVKK